MQGYRGTEVRSRCLYPDTEDQDLADYEIGFRARLDEARDKHQTATWFRGWDAAHDN